MCYLPENDVDGGNNRLVAGDLLNGVAVDLVHYVGHQHHEVGLDASKQGHAAWGYGVRDDFEDAQIEEVDYFYPATLFLALFIFESSFFDSIFPGRFFFSDLHFLLRLFIYNIRAEKWSEISSKFFNKSQRNIIWSDIAWEFYYRYDHFPWRLS